MRDASSRRRDIARVVKLIFDPPVHANGDSSAICVNHAVAQKQNDVSADVFQRPVAG